MSKNHSLRDHLRQARQTVDAWPEWKQRALGGGVTSDRRMNEADQAKPAAPATGNKGKAG